MDRVRICLLFFSERKAVEKDFTLLRYTKSAGALVSYHLDVLLILPLSQIR
jgi:hypothetical protein